MGTPMFAKEADAVAAFVEALDGPDIYGRPREKDWTVYAETAGWDLLLVHKDGYQVGLEAKLKLNPKVVAQAISGANSHWDTRGPDYRGVLVPEDGLQGHMEALCRAIGLGIVTIRPKARGWQTTRYSELNLPDERYSYGMRDWPNWCPQERCVLPDYVPDVEGGHPSPLTLTPWKIKAIKLMIVLDRRGYVTRADMKALGISPTRWCDHYHGFLKPGENRQYVRCTRTPDLRAQHPKNYAEIEADLDQWLAAAKISVAAEEHQGELL